MTGKTGPRPDKGCSGRDFPLPRQVGSHRLAQSMFLLQVPEHVLGAVRPVLFLQVPQDGPWGCEKRGRSWGHLRLPLLLPSRVRRTPPLPPAAASARLLLMAFPATKLKTARPLGCSGIRLLPGKVSTLIGCRRSLPEKLPDLPGPWNASSRGFEVADLAVATRSAAAAWALPGRVSGPFHFGPRDPVQSCLSTRDLDLGPGGVGTARNFRLHLPRRSGLHRARHPRACA